MGIVILGVDAQYVVLQTRRIKVGLASDVTKICSRVELKLLTGSHRPIPTTVADVNLVQMHTPSPGTGQATRKLRVINLSKQIKYIRVQVPGCTIVEFTNGGRACSCGLTRGDMPDLRPKICSWCGHPIDCERGKPGASPHHSFCCLDQYDAPCLRR